MLVVLLFCFQFVTLDKLTPLNPPGKYGSILEFGKELDFYGITLSWEDGLLMGLIVAAFLGLIILEWRRRQLSLLLAYVLANERRTRWVLGLSVLIAVRFYFARGQLVWTGDAPAHIAHAHFVAHSLRQGEIPIWTNFMGTGNPYMLFYGFLFFYVVGLLDLLCGNLWIALKLVLGGGHLLSGIGMYFFARAACRSRLAGFLAGLAYVLSFWHTQQILILGRLPLSLFYALLPWPFYFFEQTRFRQRRRTAVLGGGMTLGLLAFTHPGYAFWATALLALYAVLRLWSFRRRAGTARMAINSLLLLVTGVVLGAYLTLSMWLEKDGTGLSAGITLAGVPDPAWQQLLLWSNYHFPLFPGLSEAATWYGGYLGISLIVLALIGLLVPLLSRTRSDLTPHLAGGACLFLTLLLCLAYRWPVLQAFQVVQALNASRYLLFVVFFLSLMVGVGTTVLARRRSGQRYRIGACILFVIAVDLGSTTFQHLYSSEEQLNALLSGDALDALQEEVGSFREGGIPNFRLFTSTAGIHAPLALAAAHLRDIPTFQAFHPGAVRAAASFYGPFELFLNRVLEGLDDPRNLSKVKDADIIFDGLALLNVKYLMINKKDEFHFNRSGLEHTPILVSSQVAALNSPFKEGSERWLMGLIRRMGVDLKDRSCERILLLDYEGEEELGGFPSVEVLEHRVWAQRVELQVKTSQPCFARLAYGSFPQLRVKVDGQEVEPWRTAGFFIALRLEEGIHHITIEPYLSPLRRALFLLDLVIIGFAGWLLWQKRK